MILLRQTRCALSRRRHVAYFHASPAWWAARKVLQRFKLADVGEGITECEVIRWYVPCTRVSGGVGAQGSCLTPPLLSYRSVSPQSSIGVFEPLCEVQSDKASVEITSPYDGTVKEILVQEGQVAKVGEDLCIIEVDEEDFNPSDIPTSELPDTKANESGPSPPLQKQGRDAFIGVHRTPPDKQSVVARRPHPLDPNAPAASEPSASASRPGTSSGSVPTRNATDVLALPSVRHFARESEVDITLLAPGSGKDGRVERADVERYLASGKYAVPPSPPAGDGDMIVELGRTRYGMWKAMEKARTLTHLYLRLRCLIIRSWRRSYTEPGNTSLWVSEPSHLCLLAPLNTHIVIRPHST
jgi:2-oxoisovalerate dehydrogenase E2 component (dihydrolipoyl transacylase)